MPAISSYKRCGCRDTGGQCPKLRRANGSWNPQHGTWHGRAELPPAPDGSRARLRQGGFATEAKLHEWFDGALRLLSIPGDGPEGHEDRLAILALITESRRRRAPLPDFDDVLRRYRVGAAYAPGTTGEYLLAWIAERERAGDITRRTVKGYRAHIRRHFLPAFGDVPLDKLRLQHVARAFDAIDAENARIVAARASEDPAVRRSVAGMRPTGAATKQRIRATLRSALSDAAAQDRGLVAVNVAKLLRLEPGTRPKARLWTGARVKAWETAYAKRLDALDRPLFSDRLAAWKAQSLRPSPVMVWTPEQTGRFLDAIAEHRLYPVYHLIAMRGLRRGEAAGLRWEDTDLAGGHITIRTQLVQTGWDVDEDEPKTDASDETIPLDAETAAVLRDWRERQEAERDSWGVHWTDTGRVFTREDGTDHHPSTLTVVFEREACKAKLPPIRLHDLRHGAATIALASGADMRQVQALLRHASIVITMDTYTSVLPELAAELAENMARLVPRQNRPARGVSDTRGHTPGTQGPDGGLRAVN